MNKTTLGSISSGTMLPEDLIPTFVSELTHLVGDGNEFKTLIAEADNLKFDDDLDLDENIPWVLEDLFDALNEFAPPYCYFGAHEGDGADYGFWVSFDSINEAVHDGCAIKVSDLAEVPDNYCGEVFVVNDHGNLTLGSVDEKGNFKDTWAVV